MIHSDVQRPSLIGTRPSLGIEVWAVWVSIKDGPRNNDNPSFSCMGQYCLPFLTFFVKWPPFVILGHFVDQGTKLIDLITDINEFRLR